MYFLNMLYQQNKLLGEANDMSQLPNDVMNALRRSVREGAEDLEQKWANALELVHKAYEVNGVQRPTPDMRSGWSQYEEILQYAVKQLSRSRGMDGDWRMSSHVFREAMKPERMFRVNISNNGSMDRSVVRTNSIEKLIGTIKSTSSQYTVEVDRPNKQKAIITFFRHGIKQNFHVKIEEVDNTSL